MPKSIVWIIPLSIILYGYAEGVLPFHRKLGALKFMPELLLSALVSYAWWPTLGWWSLVCGVWFYLGIQSGTADLLPWRKEGVRKPERKPTLRPVVLFIANIFRIKWDTPAYAYLYAIVRGFLLSLPLGGLAALYEPLAREIGYLNNSHTLTACLLGLFYGLNIYGVLCLSVLF